jgi:1-deoxy-D-xylulose-5-phosphate reductoisomerase
LTASGGPFLNHNYEKLKNVTPQEAVKHPNWSMGKKISIDSATMMNKGLELIEAFFLFDIPYNQIEVLVHPESIIHSCVEYVDGSVLSQMGTPDMRTPISYTLAYPTRISTNVEKLNLSKVGKLTFFPPSFEKFPCLSLAYESLKIQKSAPAVLNAANEVAVEAFLNNKIKFVSIPKIVEKTLNKTSFYELNSIKDVIKADIEAREYASELIKTESN